MFGNMVIHWQSYFCYSMHHCWRAVFFLFSAERRPQFVVPGPASSPASPRPLSGVAAPSIGSKWIQKKKFLPFLVLKVRNLVRLQVAEALNAILGFFSERGLKTLAFVTSRALKNQPAGRPTVASARPWWALPSTNQFVMFVSLSCLVLDSNDTRILAKTVQVTNIL